MVSSDQLVTFKHGFVAPWEVVERLLHLEARGATFVLLPDGQFKVQPPTVLTADDVAFLKAHRDAARSCLDYVDQISREPLV